MAVVTGTEANDTLEGGPSGDSISGLAGNDFLQGLGGDDTLNGGVGNDRLFGASSSFGAVPGGHGNNLLSGGAGADSLHGGSGNDTLLGGADDDYLEDWLLGGDVTSRNSLNGGAGNDTLKGGVGRDTMDGGLGNDSLYSENGFGFLGNDLLRGGDGNDTLQADHARMEGGAGNDRFIVVGTIPNARTAVDILGGTGIDTYQLSIHPGNRAVVRSADFAAGAGGDVIDLGYFIGQARVFGLAESEDAFAAGIGHLRLVQSGAGAVLQFDLDGAGGAACGWQTVLGLRGVTAAQLTLADNFVNATGVQDLRIVAGTNSAPKLLAPIADQSMAPGAAFGFQIPLGSFGDADIGDRFTLDVALADGNPLPDWLRFQSFNQSFSGIAPAGAPLTPLNVRVTATDALGQSVSDIFVISPSTAGNDSMQGTAGNDTINGLAGNDTIDGLGGNDILSGSTGNDRLIGNAGDDRLAGSSGNDILLGSAGNDTLAGGAGNDSLNGGTGLDVFRFDTALNGSTNVDHINGFVSADDTIQLENAIFTRLTTTGTLASAAFVRGTAALDAGDRIVYDSTTGQIWYDSDGTGAAAKVLFATLAIGTPVSAADFVIT